jgi:NAD(P)-dependent dehydrogenase (short-subunit alcohol dehydrogenase family)
MLEHADDGLILTNRVARVTGAARGLAVAEFGRIDVLVNNAAISTA